MNIICFTNMHQMVSAHMDNLIIACMDLVIQSCQIIYFVYKFLLDASVG